MDGSFVITQEEMDSWIGNALRALAEDDHVDVGGLAYGNNFMPKQLHTESQGCSLEGNVNDENRARVEILQCQGSSSMMGIRQLQSDSPNLEQYVDRSQKCSNLQLQGKDEFLELQRINQDGLIDFCDDISVSVFLGILTDYLDEDRARHLLQLFHEKLNEINTLEFFRYMRNVVDDDQKLRQAVYILKMKQLMELLQQQEESWLQISEQINHLAEEDRIQEQNPGSQQIYTEKRIETNINYARLIFNSPLNIERAVQLQMLYSKRMEMDTYVFRRHVRNIVGDEILIKAGHLIQVQKNDEQVEQQAKVKPYQQIPASEPEKHRKPVLFRQLFLRLLSYSGKDKTMLIRTCLSKITKSGFSQYEVLLDARNIMGEQMLVKALQTLEMKQKLLEQPTKGYPYQFPRRVFRYFGHDITYYERKGRLRESGNQQEYPNLQESDQQTPAADPRNRDKQTIVGTTRQSGKQQEYPNLKRTQQTPPADPRNRDKRIRVSTMHQSGNELKYPNLQERRDQQTPSADPRNCDKKMIVATMHQSGTHQECPNLQKRDDKQTPSADPRNRNKQIIVDMLLPCLDKFRRNQVKAHLPRLREYDYHGDECIKYLKNIVGVENLRQALYKLQLQQIPPRNTRTEVTGEEFDDEPLAARQERLRKGKCKMFNSN